MKVSNVPSSPNLAMFVIFSKNFSLLILNPVANIMSGKKTSKNILVLNSRCFMIMKMTYCRVLVISYSESEFMSLSIHLY